MGLSLLLLAVPSAAQDAGLELISGGLTLGPPLTPVLSSPVIAVDSQGRAIVRPSAPGATVPLECWSVATSTPTRVNALLPDNHANPNLGLRPGSDEFLVLATTPTSAVKVFRIGCGVTATDLGTVALSAGLQPNSLKTIPWLSSGELVYVATAGLAKVSFSGATPTAALWVSNEALLAATVPPLDGGVAPTVSIVALAATPDDHVWLALNRNGGVGQRFIVELTPAGALTVRFGPGELSDAQTQLVYDRSLDVMLTGIAPARIGPASAPLFLTFQPRSGAVGSPKIWPRVKEFQTAFGERWNDLVPSTAGSALRNGQDGLRALGLAPAFADFDHDGLRRSEELDGGTSDLLADTDGDGVTDGLERRVYQTDPTSAASAPNVAPSDEAAQLAPTFLPAFWGVAGPGHLVAGGLSARGVLCSSLPIWGLDELARPVSCIDDKGKALISVDAALPPVFSPDLKYVFYRTSVENEAWKRGNVPGLRPMELTATRPVRWELLPLSSLVTLGVEEITARRLVRYTGNEPFSVIDLDRTQCPIVANADALTRCATPELGLPGLKTLALVGYDRTRKLGLVVVGTEQGDFLLGVGLDSAVFLTELTHLADGLTVSGIVELPGGGFALQATQDTNLMGAFTATIRLDAAYRPIVGHPQRTLDVKRGTHFGGFFKSGFFETQFDSFLKERVATGGVSCSTAGGIFSCDKDIFPPFPNMPVVFAYSTEWSVVSPAIAPGEVILWAASSGYVGGSGVYASRHPDGTYARRNSTRWVLWHMTTVGALAIWLTDDDFTQRMDPAGRAAVTSTPLSPVTAIGAAPDGLHLCLAENGPGRLWELTLDATTRRLASVTLRQPSGVTGCAYDTTGALAWSTPTALHTAQGEVALGVPGPSTGLVRLDSHWLVLFGTDTARCVTGSVVADTGLRLVAASEALGGVAYLDTVGRGFLNTRDGVCAGEPPTDELHDVDSTIWGAAYADFSLRSVNSTRGALVLRPDGLLFAATASPQVADGNNMYAPPALFALQPTYRPTSYERRLVAADPFRAAKVTSQLAGREPSGVHAMAMLPGAPADTDWGHLLRARPLELDAGIVETVDAGTGEPPGKKPGCSCQGEAGATLPLLGLVLLVALRRGRRDA